MLFKDILVFKGHSRVGVCAAKSLWRSSEPTLKLMAEVGRTGKACLICGSAARVSLLDEINSQPTAFFSAPLFDGFSESELKESHELTLGNRTKCRYVRRPKLRFSGYQVPVPNSRKATSHRFPLSWLFPRRDLSTWTPGRQALRPADCTGKQKWGSGHTAVRVSRSGAAHLSL